MIKTIEQLSIEKKTVFFRVDFNVNVKADGKIVDDTRIQAVLPTLEYALARNAKLILASHCGRPKGQVQSKYSLMPVAAYLSEALKREILFPETAVGDAVRKLAFELKEGQILLLENLRFHLEEEKNDPAFSQQLANLAQVYVNDAFGTLHRAHASTVGMVKHFQEKGIGFLVKKEVDCLEKVLEAPARPLVAIMGGAKVADKLGVVDHLLTKVDALLIGGAMAYTFLKAAGVRVGKSLVEEGQLRMAARFIEKAKLRGIPLLLPIDHRVVTEVESQDYDSVEGNIPEDRMGVDVGPKTLQLFYSKISEAKTIIWNGPMGIYEIPPFDQGTIAIAKAVARSQALTVVGGGDSAAAVKAAGVADSISHISTGGGATLAFLEGNPLPGLQALEQ